MVTAVQISSGTPEIMVNGQAYDFEPDSGGDAHAGLDNTTSNTTTPTSTQK